MERALLSFKASELRYMIEKDNGAVVTCEFCRQSFSFGSEELEQLASKSSGPKGS